MPVQPGQMLLHYRLVEKIGEGGMGVVWKAVDTTLDRDVAIKVLPDAFAKDSERLARFQREAKLLASLNHSIALKVDRDDANVLERRHQPVDRDHRGRAGRGAAIPLGRIDHAGPR